MIATRALAEHLGLSRNTVLLAYERLIAEGYLETRPAVGTFVSSTPPEQPNGAWRDADDIRAGLADGPGGGDEAERGVGPRDSLGDSAPAAGIFPHRAWRRRLVSIVDRHGGRDGPYPPGGLEELRQAIAQWLALSRGIIATRDEVIVLAGRHQAYDVVAHLLLRQGRRVVIECPGHQGAAAVFEAMGARLIHVEVDEHGIDVDLLPTDETALAHVTPSHQHPVGATLPLARRQALVEWAQRVGAYLIEDDCGGEFHYPGKRPPALMQLDRKGRVIYMGSFDHVLGAQSSLGFLVAPPDLRDAVLSLPILRDNANSALQQRVLADFIETGAFARHLRRLRKVCLARRDCLIGTLRQTLGDVQLTGTEDGTRLVWLLPSGLPPAGAIARLASGNGLTLAPWSDGLGTCDVPDHYAQRLLFIDYAATPERQIRQGVAWLATVLARLRVAGERPGGAAGAVANWPQNLPGTMPFLSPGPSKG